MSEAWEDIFKSWAKPPSKTEQDRCKNAEDAIRNAISASEELKNRGIVVFTHGSYRNNTNVRQDSDVDVGIICYDSFFHMFPEGYTRESFNIGTATYYYNQFKNDVEKALKNYFGEKLLHVVIKHLIYMRQAIMLTLM